MKAMPSQTKKAEPDIVFSYICSNVYDIPFKLIIPYM